MQAPICDNKRYVVFMTKDTFSPTPENFGTFEEAWNYCKNQVDDYKKLGGFAMHLIHASASECLAENPSGMGGNTFVRQWVWADYRNGETDTRIVCGEARIIEIQW